MDTPLQRPVAHCIGCGCSDIHACWDQQIPGPCRWIRLNVKTGHGVCSCCRDHVERFEAGDFSLGFSAAACPACGAHVPDPHRLGFVFCDRCGHCAHVHRDAHGICTMCGQPDPLKRKPA